MVTKWFAELVKTLKWKPFISVTSQLTWTVMGICGAMPDAAIFSNLKWTPNKKTVFGYLSSILKNRYQAQDTLQDIACYQEYWQSLLKKCASTALSQHKTHSIALLWHTKCPKYCTDLHYHPLKYPSLLLHMFYAFSDLYRLYSRIQS